MGQPKGLKTAETDVVFDHDHGPSLCLSPILNMNIEPSTLGK